MKEKKCHDAEVWSVAMNEKSNILLSGSDDCYLKISMETKNSEHFELIQKELTNRGYKITSNTQ